MGDIKKEQSRSVQIYLLIIVVLGAIIGAGFYIKQKRDPAPEAQVNTPAREVAEQETQCVDKPMIGQVIFDVSQPAPVVDPRVNEIKTTISASRVTWRDGSIIKIDGKDYSSGKYFATIEEGSEETALAILKSNPHVTFASNISRCQGKPKVIVD